jgi:TolA-binding protein
MTGILFASTVALLLFSSAGPQSGTTSVAAQAQGTVEQELIALDKKFDEARRKGDAAFVADLLSDDFLRVAGTAVVQTKADIVKATQSAKPIPAPPSDAPAATYTVHVLGDTALMAHATKENEVVPANAVMHVFVKQQGRWKMAGWSTVTGQPTTEQSINRAGYELMEGGKVQDAIELFKMNVRLFPQSWNTYDSLGEAYAKTGDTTLAIQNYEKSVQLNPKNETGIAALAKLKKK